MENICSPTAPKKPYPGDLWYDTTERTFYYYSDDEVWVSTEVDDTWFAEPLKRHVQQSAEEAYDRAMGVL